MVKLKLYHNCIEISPYLSSKWDKVKYKEIGTCPNLDKKFMVFEKYLSYKRRIDKLELINKKEKTLMLPIGFDLEEIKSMLMSNGEYFEIEDNSNEYIEPRKVIFAFDDNFKIRNNYQAESIDFLTSDSLFHSKMLALDTGLGKTFCAITSVYRYKLATLIISETLIDQWALRISEYTDCSLSNKGIKIIKGTDNLHRLMKRKMSKNKEVFYLTTSSTLSSYIKKYGRESINELCERLGIGIKCFDEFHMHWSQNVCIDMNIFTKHTWYLTATPKRTDFSENMVFNNVMKKIPVYGLQSFKANDHINLRLVNYDSHAKEYEIQQCMTYKGLSPILYWNYIFNSYERRIAMMGLIKMLLDPIIDADSEAKVLIYLSKIEHINQFKHALSEIYKTEEKDVKIGNYTTAIQDKRVKRREIDKHVIFTTISSGGVGLDISGLVATFSLVPYSSSITASQMIGRLRNIPDKEVYHYDFIDKSFRVMKAQREKRMMVFANKCKTLAERDISSEQIENYLNT